MVKQPTSIKISSSVRPTQSHILANRVACRTRARGGGGVLVRNCQNRGRDSTYFYFLWETSGPFNTPRRMAGRGRGRGGGRGRGRESAASASAPTEVPGATAALWQAPALA